MSNIIELTFYGHIENDGTLNIHDLKGFKAYYQQFKGKAISIDLKLKRSSRSGEQNRFFHSWCNLLAEHLGYSKDEIKEILKLKFLKVEEVNDQTGELFIYTKETSKLSKSEFADFCSDVQKWCYDFLKIRLPLPSENWEITFVS